jgi:hypothetical protein
MADLFKHLADLAVAPFVQRYLKPGIVGFLDHSYLGGRGADSLLGIALLSD